jgi:hypothetical protein
MELAMLAEIAPFVLLWMAPLAVLGFAIFLLLLSFAWFHERQKTPPA